MPIIELETEINAPPERVFDLARCVDLPTESMNKYRERAVAGVTRGLISLGDVVTWEAVHFGIKQKLSSKITAFERPRFFQDAMVTGAFKGFVHDHIFEANGEGTIMHDRFDYTSPLGSLGKFADALFLERYMTRMLSERNELIKQIAESDSWQRFIK
jgi:ligand-binding SRPBCC domain-containing protein